MKKTLTTTGIIILALAILILGVYFFAFSDTIVPASLIVTSGFVQVDSGKGLEPVTGIITLSKGDVIKTNEGARAAIILYESSVTLLEPNTQIVLTSLNEIEPIITQEQGVTFTRFASLTKIKSLAIKITYATITSKGASYKVNMDGVRTYNGLTMLKSIDGMENIAETGNALVLDNGQWNKRDITPTEKAIMKENLAEVTTAIKTVRNNLVFKNKKLLGIAEKEYGITPVMILDILTQADIGQIMPQEVARRIPVKVPVMNRIVSLTQVIAQEMQNYYAPPN